MERFTKKTLSSTLFNRVAPATAGRVRSAVSIASSYYRYFGSLWGKYKRLTSCFSYALRAFRFVFFLRSHIRLFNLEVFAKYASPLVGSDKFHHLSRRYYLSKNLRLGQRVDYILTHFRFEEHTFDCSYKSQVYSASGLPLWKHVVDGTEFEIQLALGDRYAAEGDLCVRLMVDGERLHGMSFSWIGNWRNIADHVVMYVGLNQGRWQRDQIYMERFNAAFPYNSPNFACYAALQAIAKAVRISSLFAVSSKLQVCSSSRNFGTFDYAYDWFWKAVGGTPDPMYGFSLPMPWPIKKLSEVSSKHRKRAASRRVLLDEISSATFNCIEEHLIKH